MRRRRYLSVAAAAVCGTVTGCLGAGSEGTESDLPSGVDAETVVEGLDAPWGLAFLDETWLAVTERDAGQLLLVDREDGTTRETEGVPTVDSAGQGGLLDVSTHPDYSDEPWLYLTYAAANDAGETTTHLGRGRLDVEAGRLDDFEVLHRAEPFLDRSNHYGSRVVFGPDGRLYMSVGDREFKNFGPNHVSQDLSNDLGSILRFEPDGSVPDDNPFIDDPEARDGIYSYGHRNPQGLAIHPETGELWESEHGERDGDELNIIERGGNYGWPVASEACRYGTDQPVGESHDERDDVVDPVYYWECGSGGFPPAGMDFYDGPIEAWQGDLFVGNLAGEYLGRFSVDGREVQERDPILSDRGWRLRAVETAPDTGHLYVAVDADSAPLVRLVPE